MMMNHNLNAFYREFAMFERDVRCFSDDLFNRICSSCIKPCCKPEICYESIESPFLSHLRSGLHRRSGVRLPGGQLRPRFGLLCHGVLLHCGVPARGISTDQILCGREEPCMIYEGYSDSYMCSHLPFSGEYQDT